MEEAPAAEYLEAIDLVGPVGPTEDIRWDEGQRAWLVGSMEAFKEVAADPELFRFPGDPENAPAWFDADFYVWFEGGPQKLPFLYGEQHERIHRWWIEQFGPQRIEAWRLGTVRPLVEERLDRLEGGDRADLAAELARTISLPVMLAITGLPADLGTRYESVAHRLGELRWRLLSTPDPDEALLAEAREVSTAMREILMPYVEERRDGEGDDLCSALFRFLPEVLPDCDDDALFANIATLFEAGVGTTAGAITDVLYSLIESPDAQRRLGDDPDLVPSFVEEALRMTMPALYLHRVVGADTEFRGAHLRAGDRVFAVGLAAGRDPTQFACPHQMDLGRRPLRSHVAFSHGPRFCVGHALGRMQLQEVVRGVVERYAEVSFDPAAPRPRRAGAGARRPWDRLPVILTPRRPARARGPAGRD